ncbi:UNVERIFIED_CONTAM: hypothetical protein RMT77_001037 [Armadillidium vulgare]
MNIIISFAGLWIYFVSTSAESLLTLSPSETTPMKFVGDGFFVACESKGKNVQRVMWTGPDGNPITTYRASREQTASEPPRIHIEDGSSGHRGVDIFFRNITMKDRGKYTCSANVDGNEVETSFELVIFKPIDFSDTPPEQYLEEGRDSTLICNVHGDPVPNVSWQRSGTTLKLGAGKKFSSHPENPNWIVVQNASLEDKGKYTCTAIQLSQQTSNHEIFGIEVKVHHKPFPNPSSNHINESYSYITGVVNLTCEALAEPQANFTWLKDDNIVNSTENVKIFNTDHRSILQLTVKDDNTFGDYECKAQNRLGTLARVITLEKGEKPSIPKMKVKDTKVNAFRLSIRAENNPSMPVIGYKVEYKKAGENWENASVREYEAGKPYILDGLQSDTLYGIRASSRNVAGYSDPSAVVTLKTKKALPTNQQLSGGIIHDSQCTIPMMIFFILFAKLFTFS